MMIVCAISDIHGRLPEIPACDVLLIAGDVCPDFPNPFDPDIMRIRQEDWLGREFAEWELTVPAKRILMTPGNHDWVNRLPENCRSEFYVDELVTIEEKKFYLTPWVAPIVGYDVWHYGLDRAQRASRFRDIPKGLDVLVSHSPAHKVKDRSFDGTHCGCPELRLAIYRAKPARCVFGHIHEGQRDGGPQARLGKTIMYNTAMWGRDWQPFVFELP